MKIVRVRVVLSFLLLATFAGLTDAENWPTRRLRIVVPFPAGGSGDVQVRIVADELAKALGQPVIVKNKPGASGALAAVDVAPRAARRLYADGWFGRDARDQYQPLFQPPIRSGQGFRAAHANNRFSPTH